MTLVVPFDGSELAEAALVRAMEFATVFESRVLGVSVIPKGRTEYAREAGWLDPEEEFEMERIVGALHEQVTALCPSADFTHEVVGRYATSGTIANRVRRVAKQADASMVFVGSENAGSMVSSLGSVGSSIAAENAYDVVIVRHRSPAKIDRLRTESPHRRTKSDFYLPERDRSASARER